MCRDVNHGDRRCKSDTSEARRLRRKAATARTGHSPLASVKGETVEAPADLKTLDDIKAEAAEISKILSVPVNPDPEIQKQIDAVNEVRITRLGMAMGEEAERRAGFNKEAILKAVEEEGETLVTARKEVQDAADNYKKLMREYSSFCKTEEYIAKEDFAVQEEERLRNALQEAHRRNMQAKKDLPGIEEADAENRRMLPVNEAEKLAQTYREMIAEIRPVGGEIKAHELSDEAAKDMLAQTVGSHYPTSWLKDSSDAGAVAMISVKEKEARASYSNRKLHNDPDGPGALVLHTPRVTAEEAAKLREAFGDDEGFNDDTPFMEYPGEDSKKMVTIPVRVPFDPSKDKQDASGKPVGEGWKKGRVLISNTEVGTEEVWYRHKVTEGKKAVPTVTVAIGRTEANNRASAYHEFAHRLEEKVGGGVIMRLEESFDARRTTNSEGVREPLAPLYPERKELAGELGRRDGYMLPYIGKQYAAGHQREIFTVGTEAMFSGKFGAFTGIPDANGHAYKEDKDHRAFMLGTFATV